MQKYLRKSCYHRIQCTAATFLAAFIWRRPLNSVVSTTITRREPRKIFDETGTQVKAGIVDKCTIKMA